MCDYIENLLNYRNLPDVNLDANKRKILELHKNFIPNTISRSRIEERLPFLNFNKNKLIEKILKLNDINDFERAIKKTHRDYEENKISQPKGNADIFSTEKLEKAMKRLFSYKKQGVYEIDYYYQISDSYIKIKMPANRQVDLIDSCLQYFSQYVKEINDKGLILVLTKTLHHFVWKIMYSYSKNYLLEIIKSCYSCSDSEKLYEDFVNDMCLQKNNLMEKVYYSDSFPKSESDYIVVLKLAYKLRCTPAYLLGLTDSDCDFVYSCKDRLYGNNLLSDEERSYKFIEFMIQLEYFLDNIKGREELLKINPLIFNIYQNTTVAKYISLRLRMQLEKKNILQKQLANCTGLSEDYISKLIGGRIKIINYNNILKISSQLLCTPDYLVGLVEDETEDRFGKTNPIQDLDKIKGYKDYRHLYNFEPELAELLNKCSRQLKPEKVDEIKAVIKTYLQAFGKQNDE